MAEKANLHSVAAHAGVSIATVSKVVNGIHLGMSQATLERVQASINELGYRPNRTGRGLRTLRRFMIGLAVVDPSPTFLTDPFTTNLVAGLSNYLSEQDFGLLLHGIKPRQVEQSFLVRENVVDAFCLMLSGSANSRRTNTAMFAGLNHPLVVFQCKPDETLQDICYINQDDRGGALELAKHILLREPANALIVIPDIFWPAIEKRVEAFWEVLRGAGVATKVLRCDEHSADHIGHSISQHIGRHGLPDVILGGNDKIAVAALQMLDSRGVSVPDQVAVSGFNAFEQHRHAGGNLTSASSPAYEMGVLGGKLLLKRLQSTAFEKNEYTLPVKIIPGATA
ncbi:LacI family DNA-binding transcriptional regulator [Aureimonas fodinaquatilis]|uniref:LacI family DNA-binding transcriptional regulator n=1 Tax=Aureimonas fodinaquatilis TaxID=2565783 RepID=UPI001FE3C7C2|nr:LacI family DNA-binding transcriptional regulator [Aureimonas fodinaquatilis]